MIAIKSDQQNIRAIQLSERLNLPLETDLEASNATLLGWHNGKLALFPEESGPVYIDFLHGKLAHRRKYGGGNNQPIARATGISGKNHPSVIDATAGMGRDSFVLASLGCRVKMIERSPVLCALLEDALDRARQDTEVADIADRMTVECADACDFLSGTLTTDVIYLDPMYPEKRKSAAVKKDMRILQKLVGPDLDSHKLLNIALQKAIHRVVVKRPKRADPVKGPQPDTSISSPNTRYDIYLLKPFNR